MNKKFSTLLVSALLAGGLFSANAQQERAVLPSDVAGNGFYHVMKLHGVDATVPYGTSWSVSLKDGKLVAEETFEKVEKANAWTVTEVKVNGKVLGYKFSNADGVALQFDTNGKFTSKAADVVYTVFAIKKGILCAVNPKNGSVIDGKKLEIATATKEWVLGSTGTSFQMYTLPVYELTAEELNDKLGDGFEITIGKTKEDKKYDLTWDGAYDLEGNVFANQALSMTKDGELTYKDAQNLTKYIVLTKNSWSALSNSLEANGKEGLKFAAMTEEQIKKSDKILATKFKFTQPNAFTEEPLEVKAIDADGAGYELMVSNVEKKYYLTTGDANNKENSDTQRVGLASFTYGNDDNTGAFENTYVKFGSDNYADMTIFNDKIWSIVRTEYDWNGKPVKTLTAGPACYNTWVAASQVNTDYPEGQWLWTGSVFKNRESGESLYIPALRKTEKSNVYTWNSVTYEFTEEGKPGNVFLGYYNEKTDDQLKQEAFYIGTPIKASGDTFYVAKDEDGVLYLSKEIAEAVEFRLERYTFGEDVAGSTKNSDLIQHFTKYASSTEKSGFGTDVLNFYTYTLTEASTNAKLSYDYTAERFTLTDKGGYAPFLIKNKGVDVYNLVQNLSTVDHRNDKNEYLNEKTEDAVFCLANKIYAGQNTAELKAAENAYASVANDLFVLKPVTAGQHVSNIEGDTVKIFRNVDHNYFLFEHEGFLDLKNFLDPAYKNAALYVDSAAGKGTWRQEYLLAVGVTEHKDGMMCPFNPLHNDQTWRDEHNNGKPCADAVHVKDFKTGRYLVNLVDSAKAQAAAGVKDAKNIYKFQNYTSVNEPYYRLGFVAATHVEDSLIIASTNDTIVVSSNNFNDAKVCDFAFHYVDADRKAFIIETAYDYYTWVDETTEEVKYRARSGYVKFHNGLPVVTPKKSEAEVFDLEETEEAPTANEGIATSEVAVIAGEGNVTIAGAAGKKVVISNILGQVVANTVIASDNATIAVPQGVVVVAVEGEEAVKAIVK